MITIFCNFRQFSAKKLAFFSKTNVTIKIFHNLALFRVKNANFFAENIFKIITSVPGCERGNLEVEFDYEKLKKLLDHKVTKVCVEYFAVDNCGGKIILILINTN
jgi:hypothetical protein